MSDQTNNRFYREKTTTPSDEDLRKIAWETAESFMDSAAFVGDEVIYEMRLKNIILQALKKVRGR